MGNDWQTWLVLALVLLAAAYSVWYLLPASLKKPLGALHQALANSPACGACNSCGKCATPAKPPRVPDADAPLATQPITFHRRKP